MLEKTGFSSDAPFNVPPNMSAKILCVAGFILAVVAVDLKAQVIFTQDFSASTTVADYVNSTSPTNGQWNSISVSGAGTTVSITNGALVFSRTGNAGSFSRTTDFSPTPTALMVQFSLSVSGNTSAQTTAAVFQIGSGFGTANSAETNANTYTRFGINLGGTAGEFTLRNLATSTNSGTLSGTQALTWVINNTGGSITYTAPDSTTRSLSDDTAELWAGNSIVLSAMAATTASQTMTDMKFAFTAGTGSISFDNFVITAIPEPSTYAALAGLAALIGVMVHRRRQRLSVKT